MKIPGLRPEPARDGFGRYRLPDPASGRTRSWTRATTLAGSLSDQYAISRWRQRKVAHGLARRRDLLDPVGELGERIDAAEDWRDAKEYKAELDALVDQAAHAAGADSGSEIGSTLHTVTEWYDVGRLDEIADLLTEDLITDLAAYAGVMDAHGIERPAEHVERIVINEQVDSAGTYDRLLRLPDGRLVVGDLKTQQTLAFGFLSIALQLAEYAHAEHLVDPVTGELTPMPEVDREMGIVMHLPAGSGVCTLYSVDLVEGWHAARVAHEVRQLRSRSKAMGAPWPGPEPLPYDQGGTLPPSITTDGQGEIRNGDQGAPDGVVCAAPSGTPRTVTRSGGDPGGEADRILFLIRAAQHPDALRGLWADLSGRGEWTDEMTAAAAARKAELLQGVA